MLYEIIGDQPVPVPTSSFCGHGESEATLCSWIVGRPSMLHEDLLILNEDCSTFAGSNVRPDVLALDRQGRLVLIEVKRDVATRSAIAQVLTYVGFASRLTVQLIVEIFGDYLERLGNCRDSASPLICRFLGEPDPAQLTLNPPLSQRAVVVAGGFSTDARVAADWLVDQGVPIQFFETVYMPQEERCLLDLSEINPPFMSVAQPGSAEARLSLNAVVAGPVIDNAETYQRFWEHVMERFKLAGDERFGSGTTPSGNMLLRSWHSRGGVRFALIMNKAEAGVGMSFFRAEDVLDALIDRRADIERRFGDALDWRRGTNRFGVFCDRSILNEGNWSEIAEWMVETLPRFVAAVEPALVEVLAES